MIKSVTFNTGHTLSGGDTGAEGCGYKEQVLTRGLVQQLIGECNKWGIVTHISRVDYAPDLNTSLYEQVRICNSYNVDMNVCIHFNASNDGRGNGTEIFTYQGKEVPEARRILNNMEKLGFQNRGIKNTELALINNTQAETIYIEVCFIDNAHDMSIFINKQQDVVDAIIYGLLGKSIPPIKPVEENDIMNKIVLYFGDMDALSALYVAQKNQCPMMKESDFNEQKLKAKQVIKIGGKPNSNRYDSLKDAAKLV